MEQKPTASNSLQKVVLGIFVLVILGIVARFILSRQQGPPLPVVSQVTPFALNNQENRTVSLDDLKEHVWVADIIFTRCQSQCARMTRNMSALQADLPSDGSVKYVSLTADPANDTPEVLKLYGERYGAKANWNFLTGAKKDIYRLAMDGLKLAVEETKPEERQSIDDMFIHSNKFIIVDKRGQIRAWFDGDNAETKRTILVAVRRLLNE